jgi:uncharacterized membrane protein (UPF0127 family)
MMKDLQQNQPLVKNKALLFDFKKAESYEHERYELSIDMIFINMSKEVVGTFFEAR